MFPYILLAIGISFITFLYRMEAHLVLKDTAVIKYRRWRRLNQLVSTTERNNVRIAWISFKMVMYTLYITFLQYMNTSVRKLDRKTYEVTYVINGRLYKMIVVPKRGPIPVLQISNDRENDVTDYVLPYMGPQYNWHGSRLTPQFFGYHSLTFELGDGTDRIYEGNNQIDIIT
jgi:hypothetical protein